MLDRENTLWTITMAQPTEDNVRPNIQSVMAGLQDEQAQHPGAEASGSAAAAANPKRRKLQGKGTGNSMGADQGIVMDIIKNDNKQAMEGFQAAINSMMQQTTQSQMDLTKQQQWMNHQMQFGHATPLAASGQPQQEQPQQQTQQVQTMVDPSVINEIRNMAQAAAGAVQAVQIAANSIARQAADEETEKQMKAIKTEEYEKIETKNHAQKAKDKLGKLQGLKKKLVVSRRRWQKG